MKLQAEHVGTEMIRDHIISADLKRRPFALTGDSHTEYTADALIIATGAQARWLGLESEQRFRGYGVSACATCDGFFFRGKNVLVVGGGNTAVEEALFLTNFADSVTLAHRRDSFRAEKILQNRLFANPKIKVLWNAVLEEVIGSHDPKMVTGARIRNVKTEEDFLLPIDGIFVAIGHVPATELFVGQLPMKQGNYLITVPNSTATPVAGVYAAGDVADDVFRQAVTAAGMGCMAALEAERWLARQGSLSEAAE